MIPEDLFYTKEHEWVRFEEKEAVIGITDYAQSELGDITFVELPDTDREVKQFENIATVESVKAASDVYTPVSGRIISVNGVLNDKPELINQSPYGDGWICRIVVACIGEKEKLMDAASYARYVEESKK